MSKQKFYKEHRFQHNPKEKEFVDTFIKEHDDYCGLDLIVFGQHEGCCMTPKQYLTKKQRKIALSVIQWLGSPVGNGFLHQMGYELKRDKK